MSPMLRLIFIGKIDMMKAVMYICLCLFCNTVFAQNIMEVEEHFFKSATYHDIRSFRVALPVSTYPNVKYNVILVLDSDYIFDVVASTAVYLQTFDYIPPTAVISVDYSSPGNRNDVGYNIDINTLDGSGELFYDYVNEDLLREINRILPTSGFNTLIGHSYTSSYLCYCISKNEYYMKSYVLFSPEEIGQIPSFELPGQSDSPIIRIVAATDDTDSRLAFADSIYGNLKEKQYDVKLRTINADHMTVVPIGITQALTDLYDKYYTIDSIYQYVDKTGQSIWESFMEVNNNNYLRYNQELPISGPVISAFLWTAIQNKDCKSIERLICYYDDALRSSESDPNALGVMGDLLAKIGKWKEADFYLQRCLDRYSEIDQKHETLYWRKTYALNVLPKLGQYEKAWMILEEGKQIYPEDKAIFSYYQGLMSITNKYCLSRGIEELKYAIRYPQILKNNFVEPNNAEALLNKGAAMEELESDD